MPHGYPGLAWTRSLNVYTISVYTDSVLDDLRGFDWDVHNIGHIATHDVSPGEIEEVVRSRHIIVPAAARGGETRWKLFGKTAAGRYLVDVFTVRHERFRTVTAYTLNQAERRVDGPEIEG